MKSVIIFSFVIMLAIGCKSQNSAVDNATAGGNDTTTSNSGSVTGTVEANVVAVISILSGSVVLTTTESTLNKAAQIILTETEHPASDFAGTVALSPAASVAITDADTGLSLSTLGDYNLEIIVSLDLFQGDINTLSQADFVVLAKISGSDILSEIYPTSVAIDVSAVPPTATVSFISNNANGIFGVSIINDDYVPPSDNSDGGSATLTDRIVHVCFTRNIGGNHRFMHSYGKGAEWTTEYIGEIDENYGDGRCPIAIDKDNNIALFNNDHEFRHQVYTYNGSSWTDRGETAVETVEQQTFGTLSSSAFTSDGALNITYEQYNNLTQLGGGEDGLLHISQPLGGSGLDTVVIDTISSANNPYTDMSLAIDKNDVGHIALMHDDGASTYTLRYTSSSNNWGSIITVPVPAFGNFGFIDPYAITDDDNNLYVFYRNNSGTTCDLRRVTKTVGGSWQDDQKILEFGPQGVCGDDHYQVAIDPTGKFHIGYRKQISGTNYLYYAQFDGSSWTEEEIPGGGEYTG